MKGNPVNVEWSHRMLCEACMQYAVLVLVIVGEELWDATWTLRGVFCSRFAIHR